MSKTLFAAFAALAIAAAPAFAGEQPHDGRISPTYAGGFVGPQSGEAGGGFELSGAMPLYSGGQAMNVHSAEAGSSFDAMLATKVGRGIETSRIRG